jgi:hypothetical protein
MDKTWYNLSQPNVQPLAEAGRFFYAEICQLNNDFCSKKRLSYWGVKRALGCTFGDGNPVSRRFFVLPVLGALR